MEKRRTQLSRLKQAWQGSTVRWGFALLAAACAGVGLSYWWRVFFYLDARFPPLTVTLGCAAFACAVVGAAALLRFGFKDFAARGAVCILLCGLLFAFANPPLQTPDEGEYYLRTYSISQGHLDFDGARAYPDDVAALLKAFPDAWVNAHTSVGVGTDPITGLDRAYNTKGYALKQYGDTAPVQGIADSFAEYFALTEQGGLDPVHEPLRFLLLPFLPGALGMAAARLLGFGALGCLYGGRVGNLLAYTALCWLALKKAQRCRPLLLGCMLLPLSLYLGASLSYDATLLAGYILMLALLTREDWDAPTLALYGAVCVFVNIAKPYLNLLWVLLPLLVRRRHWCFRWKRRWTVAALLLATLAVIWLTEWYGGPASPFRHNYPVEIPRQGGEAVNGMGQLLFILAHPFRYAAAAWGTLYENAFFLGQLGVFGALDLPVQFLNLTGPLVLLLAALLCAGRDQGLEARRIAGLGVFAAVYGAGAMTAMYITYTPVGMVRIVGLQARYFLPVFLALALCLSALLRRTLRPDLTRAQAETLALPLGGAYAALGALLLFQHYFIGPFYTIPV